MNLVVVSDPKLADEILHTKGVEFGSYRQNMVFDIFTDKGQDMVFSIYGDHWQKMRRVVTASFTNKVVQQYREKWEEKMDLVVKDLYRDEKASVEGVVIRRRLLLMQYNILYRMMFDTRFESMEDPLLEQITQLKTERTMLEAEKNGEINEKNVKHIVENINVAGIETTLWSMEWAIVELVNHPNVQSKLQDEISNILEGNPLTESDLDRLPYLQAVVKETLRLHTPIPLLLPHMNLEDAELNGYTIPKGPKVVVNAWWLPNNPAWWKKSEEFLPERFLEEEGGTDDVRGGRVDFRYLPFGVGRRSCPGIILALPILGIVIGKLVMNFELCPPEGMEKINASERGGLFSLRITNHSTVAFRLLKVCSN
ncbi:hypothetical protein AAC387_Pa09g2298 [Persea americana]